MTPAPLDNPPVEITPLWGYGERSMQVYRELDPRLQKILSVARAGPEITLLEGLRGRERQNRMVRVGRSQVRWPHSAHNTKDNEPPVLAVDWAPWYPESPHIRWEETERFRYVAHYLLGIGDALGHPLKWGGDWDGDWSYDDQQFHDLGHIELVG